MASTTELKRPKWLRDLERLLGIRRQFVLERNIRDEVALPAEKGFQLLPFNDALHSELRRLGYNLVILWNPVTGLVVFPKDEKSIEAARSIPGLESLNDQGELDMTSPLKLSGLVGRLALNEQQDPACALVIDYASRIAKSAASLTDDERDFFRACEKAANDARSISRNGGQSRFNPIIWLCNRAQDLPSWFLIDSPSIYSIACATPDLDTRLVVARSVVRALDPKADEAKMDIAARTLASQTEGMRLSALKEIKELAKKDGIGLDDIDDAVRSYQLGDQVKDSPWRSQALRTSIRNAHSNGFFTARVKGQPLAVTKVLDTLKRSVFGLTGAHTRSSQGRPKGIMFFAGPTGVGKTEMAKAIAKLIFDIEHSVLRFDMSEFSSEHSDARLIGAPPGYVGYEVGGELTNALREKPYRVILFDEIEKAHPRILDKFLQILEDGRLTDGRGETVYFSESLIIFTSNLGVYVDGPEQTRILNVSPDTKPYEELERKIREAIMDHFRFKLNRPEILNRIGQDNIVVFNFIQPDVAREIFKGNLSGICEKLKEEGDIVVTLEESARLALEKHCIADLLNGGRGIGACLEAAFTNSLTRELFDCDAEAGSSWKVTRFYKDDTGAFAVELEATT